MSDGIITFARPFRRGPTGGLAETATLEDAVAAVIADLVETDEGELPMEPDFGSKVRRRRYDPNDALLAADLRESVRRAIQRWEPRAQLVDVKVVAEGNATLIEILYRVAGSAVVHSLRRPWPGATR